MHRDVPSPRDRTQRGTLPSRTRLTRPCRALQTMNHTKCLPWMMTQIKLLSAGHPVAEVFLIGFSFAYLVEGVCVWRIALGSCDWEAARELPWSCWRCHAMSLPRSAAPCSGVRASWRAPLAPPRPAGASGFGTPVALAAPMLASLGHEPLATVACLLVMNTLATQFGERRGFKVRPGQHTPLQAAPCRACL
jgi:hypothetical protein